MLLKPSELTVHAQDLLCKLVPKYLDQSAIRVVTGGAQETTFMLEMKFNHIFFTGSSKVAKFVSAAAAKHLTPVVLELGGQGPAIVTRSADINLAARRIAYAKFQNAGQICLCVNHVFAEPEIADELIEKMKYWNDQFLGKGDSHMTCIINDRHFSRLTGLLEKTSGELVYNGPSKPENRFFHPTIVDGVDMDDSLLSEEIFGPICPVIRASVDQAITSINSLPEPLALYIFGSDQKVIDDILDRTISGGVCINNVMFHAGVPGAPFGGVGNSGQGTYHGRYGVECFTHNRCVVDLPTWIDKLMGFMYAPYDEKYVSWFNVSNSIGFKRGETLEDQETKSYGIVKTGAWAAVIGAASYAIMTTQGHRIAAAFK